MLNFKTQVELEEYYRNIPMLHAAPRIHAWVGQGTPQHRINYGDSHLCYDESLIKNGIQKRSWFIFKHYTSIRLEKKMWAFGI
jgi:hypothetical protein